MTNPCRNDGNSSSRCSNTGTDDVVREVRNERGRRGRAATAIRSASAVIDLEPVGVAPAPSAQPSLGNAAGERRVDLDGDDLADQRQQRQRQRSEAGPDLEHDVVSGQLGNGRTIRRTVFASMTKFWPQRLGRPERRAASARSTDLSAGTTRAPAASGRITPSRRPEPPSSVTAAATSASLIALDLGDRADGQRHQVRRVRPHRDSGIGVRNGASVSTSSWSSGDDGGRVP